MTLKSISEKFDIFRKLVYLLDAFFMKYLGVLILLIIPFGLIRKYIFDVDEASQVALPLVLIAAILMTLLWIKLDSKVRPSLFNGYVSSFIKKQELIKRGFLFFVMTYLMGQVNEELAKKDQPRYLFYFLSKFYLIIGIFVIAIAFVMILLSSTRRKSY